MIRIFKKLSLILVFMVIALEGVSAKKKEKVEKSKEHESVLSLMSVVTLDSSSVEMQHFPLKQIQGWDVLVIDSPNTKEAFRWLTEKEAQCRQGGNLTAAQDCNSNSIQLFQIARLNTIFRSVSFEAKAGKLYDLVIIRDFFIDMGKMSGKTCTVDLSYWFVYKVGDGIEIPDGAEYVFRGEFGICNAYPLPYPATTYGLQSANKACVRDIEYILEGGLDLYTAPSAKNQGY